MLIQVIQHEDEVGPGHIAVWAGARGHELAFCRPDRGQPFPEIRDGQLLVILGGTMGVNDERIHPWLTGEKRYLEQAIARGHYVLGVCLGGQLLSSVLGGVVGRHTQREIGWHRLSLLPAAAQLPCFAGYPQSFITFQWHQDTFSIPAGCLHLAESPACAHQAFSYEGRAIALQFHCEANLPVIRSLTAAFPEALEPPGPYTQSAAQMLAASDLAAQSTRLTDGLLDRLAEDATAALR